MRLLPKKELKLAKSAENEARVVKSIRITEVFEREKRALNEFREKRREQERLAESRLDDRLAELAEERRVAEDEYHYLKERKDAVMPSLESLKRSLEEAREIAESERETNVAESERLHKLERSLKEMESATSVAKDSLERDRSILHDRTVILDRRETDLLKDIKLLTARTESLDLRESKLLRDVEIDRKLMSAQMKELTVRNGLLDEREKKLDAKVKRLERSQQTLKIAREQFLKEKSEYGGECKNRRKP